MPGDYHPLFVGAHHLVYEYAFELAPGLPVKLHWLFATGRDHPLLAIHYDMTGLSPRLRCGHAHAVRGHRVGRRRERRRWDGGLRRRLGRSLSLCHNQRAADDEQRMVVHGAQRGPLRAGVDRQDQCRNGHRAKHKRKPSTTPAAIGCTETGARPRKIRSRTTARSATCQLLGTGRTRINQYELCYDDPKCVDSTTRVTPHGLGRKLRSRGRCGRKR